MTLTARRRLAILLIALAALVLSLTAPPWAEAQQGPVPDKPTGVVTAATHDSVTLTWDDPGDSSITHYQVFRRDRDVHDFGEFVTIKENTNSAAASYIDDTVEPERRYVYRVKAVNAHGASRWSDYRRANTPEAPTPVVPAPICNRTMAVQRAILSNYPNLGCSHVTADHLRAINSLDLSYKSITALEHRDFRGLSGLDHLDLANNQLTRLPNGIFDDLTDLDYLLLSYNRLTELPEGIFDDLDPFLIRLHNNELTALPDGVFDNSTGLYDLWLDHNELTALPDGIFDRLIGLHALYLSNNELTALPDGVFDKLVNLSYLDLGGNAIGKPPGERIR